MPDELFTTIPGEYPDDPPAFTPYPDRDGYTGGHAGSDTSRDRAQREATDGTLSERQQSILACMRAVGASGWTVAELRHLYPEWHHGQISAALTTLHKAGRIARLAERRNGCAIYVDPEQVHGRSTMPAARTDAGRHRQAIREIHDLLDAASPSPLVTEARRILTRNGV